MNVYVKKALKNKQFMCLFILAIVMILAAVFAANFAPADPLKQHYDYILKAESLKFPMGTDQLGRCVLSRIMHGGRTSLLTIFAIV